jgi:hypothetical protein
VFVAASQLANANIDAPPLAAHHLLLTAVISTTLRAPSTAALGPCFDLSSALFDGSLQLFLFVVQLFAAHRDPPLAS